MQNIVDQHVEIHIKFKRKKTNKQNAIIILTFRCSLEVLRYFLLSQYIHLYLIRRCEALRGYRQH